jgi:glucosamine-6-phosphate deaminase
VLFRSGRERELRELPALLTKQEGLRTDAVAAMLDGPLTTRCPASWLQAHPDVTFVLDRAAVSARRAG